MFVDNEPHDTCGKSQPGGCVEVLINTGWGGSENLKQE